VLDISLSSWSSTEYLLAIIILIAGTVLGSLAGLLLYSKARYRARQATQNLAASQTATALAESRLHDLQARYLALQQRFDEQSDQLLDVEKRYVELETRYHERLARIEQLKEFQQTATQELKLEFQALAQKIFNETGKGLAELNQTSLHGLLQPLQAQLLSFQKRANDIHAETLKGNASLGAEIRQLAEAGLQVEDQAKQLTQALRGDNKRLGNWGEVLLERSLTAAGLVKGEHYEVQPVYHTESSQRRQPDFVLLLPEGKQLIVDSKVSLVDYERAVSAANPDLARQAIDAHVRATRRHIDDLHAKNYSSLPGINDVGFVLMYMPLEPAYIAALEHSPDLYDYAWRKEVMLVSHTTFMPLTRMIATMWRTVKSQEQTRELSRQAAAIRQQTMTLSERLKRLGLTLGTVSRHYNDVVTAVAGQQGLHNKLARFANLSLIEPQELPTLQTLQADFRHQILPEATDDED